MDGWRGRSETRYGRLTPTSLHFSTTLVLRRADVHAEFDAHAFNGRDARGRRPRACKSEPPRLGTHHTSSARLRFGSCLAGRGRGSMQWETVAECRRETLASTAEKVRAAGWTAGRCDADLNFCWRCAPTTARFRTRTTLGSSTTMWRLGQCRPRRAPICFRLQALDSQDGEVGPVLVPVFCCESRWRRSCCGSCALPALPSHSSGAGWRRPRACWWYVCHGVSLWSQLKL